MKCLTKIVATVGPACVEEKTLKKMISTGVSVFRLNLKHNDIQWHKNVIKLIGKITNKNRRKVGIMIDLLGPELRVKTNNIDIQVVKDEEICLADTFIPNRKSLTLSKNGITKDIKVNQKIYIDNGLYEFRVVFSKMGLIMLKSKQDCLIKNGKSVAIPGIDNKLPSLTHKDFDVLSSFSRLPIDFVCLSFCRTADDVNKLKQVLLTKKINANIVAKVENSMALKNIE